MNTPNPTTGEIRPNCDLSPEERIALAALPAVSDAETHYNALVCQLDQTAAVLRLMLNDAQRGAVSPTLVSAAYGLETLLELCDEPHERLCDGLGWEFDSTLQTGYLLDQCRAVMCLLLDAVTGDGHPATTVSNALGALSSLLGLVRAELRRISLETLAQASRAGAGEARP